MYDLDSNVINLVCKMKDEGCLPAQIMRAVFKSFGEISPPIMAQYFKAAYGGLASDFMPALSEWWHDGSSEISDSEFDRKIFKAFSDS